MLTDILPFRLQVGLFLFSKGDEIVDFTSEQATEITAYAYERYRLGREFVEKLIAEYKDSSFAAGTGFVEGLRQAKIETSPDLKARVENLGDNVALDAIIQAAIKNPDLLITEMDRYGDEFAEFNTFSIPEDFTFFAKAAADAVAYHVPVGAERERYDELTGAGEGEVIAVLDTGVNSSHPDLAGKLLGVFSEVPGESGEDINGHGTHVMGTCVGPKEICLSHKAKGVSIKVLGGRQGAGQSNWIAAGFRRARLWRGPNGERVTHANASLGGGGRDAETEREIELCVAAGIVVNCAAGNDGWRRNVDLVNWPARSVFATTVGAIDENENVAAFTSGGPLLDTAAAGVGVVSSAHTGGRVAFSGTSMATPVTSSKSASTQSFLVRNGFARLDGTLEFRDFLKANSRDIFDEGHDDATGNGILDVYETLLDESPDDVTILASGKRSAIPIASAIIAFAMALLSFGTLHAQSTVELRTVVKTIEQTDIFIGDEKIQSDAGVVVNTTEKTEEVPVIDIGSEATTVTVIGKDLKIRHVESISPGKFAISEPGEYLVFREALPDSERHTVIAPKPEFDLSKIAPLAKSLADTINDLPTRVALATAYEKVASEIVSLDQVPGEEGWASDMAKQAALEAIRAVRKVNFPSQQVDWVNGFQRPLKNEIFAVGFVDVENYRLALLEVVKGLRDGLEMRTTKECNGVTCIEHRHWIRKQ